MELSIANSATSAASAFGCGAAQLGMSERNALGTVLVVAPHADDESLGCGGLIALLCDVGQTVWIVLVSDGARSHPGSLRYDAAARRDLREAELRDAASCLGVPAARVLTMRLSDGALPGPGHADFESAADSLRAIAETTGCETLLAPWRRDPHCDHRATSALARRALECMIAPASGTPPRLLEYLVWVTERAAPGDLPAAGEAKVWRVDIRAVQDRKRAAISAHRSQAGLVITDDPHGFTLSPGMRERAAAPDEYYFEAGTESQDEGAAHQLDMA